MALGAALVDRARLITQEPQPLRVRGATVFAPVRGAWFKARLTLPAAPEAAEAPTYRNRAVRTPTLLYGIRDSGGNAVALSLETRVEVDSKAFGRTLWDVAAQPQPLRKKRRVIGWTATLRRVEDAELPDAEAV